METTGAGSLAKAGCTAARRVVVAAAPPTSPRATILAPTLALAQAIVWPQEWGPIMDPNNSTTARLCFLATTLEEFIAGDIATEARALALRAWANSTTRH